MWPQASAVISVSETLIWVDLTHIRYDGLVEGCERGSTSIAAYHTTPHHTTLHLDLLNIGLPNRTSPAFAVHVVYLRYETHIHEHSHAHLRTCLSNNPPTCSTCVVP